jgi:hypothetical protein
MNKGVLSPPISFIFTRDLSHVTVVGCERRSIRGSGLWVESRFEGAPGQFCNNVQICVVLQTMSMSQRMPVSVAARKGVSALAHEAADHRVILTSLGRAVAVVDSPERVDEDLRLLRNAARTVVESMADLVANRTGRLSLEEACAKLGISEQAVKARAEQLAAR